MTPIPVVYAICGMPVGGTQRHLLEVLRHLDRARFVPLLYCLGIRAGDHYAVQARALGIEVLDGGMGATLRGPGLLTAVRRLAAELRRRRVRLIHSYLFHANFVGTLAARVARVPVALISKRNLDSYSRARDRWICRVANALADGVTVPAEAVRQHIHRRERCPLEKITVIPNGITLERVAGCAGAAAETRPPGPRIGTIGRLVDYKGPADLLAAVPVVLGRFPEASFVLVGDGPLRPALESLARRLGIERSVHLMGELAEGTDVLSALDVVVVPSRRDGMSNSLLEAMAAGRPVVATDVGGNAELLGDAGLLVPPRNPACLAEAIVTVLEDSERARGLGEEARRRARLGFSAAAMMRRLEALYRDLLTARGVAVD